MFDLLVIALERSRVLVPGPVGLEGDLGHLPLVGPAGGDALGPLGRAAVHQDHRRMLLAHLVEGRPDPGVVVVVDPAREGDARTGWDRVGEGPRSRPGAWR